jgi:AraC-like DNA-binding protein
MLCIARGRRASREEVSNARPSGPARRGEVRCVVMGGNVRPDRSGDKSQFRTRRADHSGDATIEGMDLMTPGYREWAPPPALAPLVACLWARVCGGDDEVRVMPDGASDVIWRRGHGTMIVGPDTTARAHPCVAGELMLGMRFRPGAGGGAIGMPLDELRDRQVHARDIDRAFDLDGELPPATVLTLLHRAAADRRPDPIVLAAAPHVAERGVVALARELAISERQLRRRFHAAVGYGPGTLARVQRFRRFLALLDAGRDDLAGLAFDAGYADQAHLTRESRRLAGLSPARVIQSRRAA